MINIQKLNFFIFCDVLLLRFKNDVEIYWEIQNLRDLHKTMTFKFPITKINSILCKYQSLGKLN